MKSSSKVLVCFTGSLKGMDLCFTQYDLCLQEVPCCNWKLVDGQKNGNVEWIDSVRGATVILLKDGFQANVDQS